MLNDLWITQIRTSATFVVGGACAGRRAISEGTGTAVLTVSVAAARFVTSGARPRIEASTSRTVIWSHNLTYSVVLAISIAWTVVADVHVAVLAAPCLGAIANHGTVHGHATPAMFTAAILATTLRRIGSGA